MSGGKAPQVMMVALVLAAATTGAVHLLTGGKEPPITFGIAFAAWFVLYYYTPYSDGSPKGFRDVKPRWGFTTKYADEQRPQSRLREFSEQEGK